MHIYFFYETVFESNDVFIFYHVFIIFVSHLYIDIFFLTNNPFFFMRLITPNKMIMTHLTNTVL